MEIKVFRVSSPPFINQCYLAYAHGTGILIDPAWDFTLINHFLVQHQVRLDGVFLTHAHDDHTHLAEAFARWYHVPVFMSAAEIHHSGFVCPNLVAVHHLHEVRVGKLRVTPILTPGHTSGSTCYLVDEHLFTGDTVFIEGVGLCQDANQLYDSVQFLKNHLPATTVIWPGHSYGQPAGRELAFVLENNIYFQFTTREPFVNFRMRKNQANWYSFK